MYVVVYFTKECSIGAGCKKEERKKERKREKWKVSSWHDDEAASPPPVKQSGKGRGGE